MYDDDDDEETERCLRQCDKSFLNFYHSLSPPSIACSSHRNRPEGHLATEKVGGAASSAASGGKYSRRDRPSFHPDLLLMVNTGRL